MTRTVSALGWWPRFEAFDSFSERFGYPSATAYRSGYMRGIESIAHEMAHAMVLTIPVMKGKPGAGVSERHEKMRPARSDASEINTLAVEWLALRALGLKVSMRRLADYAASDMETSRYKLHPVIIERAAMAQTSNRWVRGRARKMEQIIRKRAVRYTEERR